MATVITMPRLSDTMTEGTVAAWLKKVGDKISEGDILAEIETDKATMEFESFNSGTLLYIGIPEGESAPVDSLLAIIGNEGEDISGLLNGDTVSLIKEEKAEIAPVANTQDLKPETTLPKGVVVVTMPRLSDTMTDGTVATWLKKVGDKVAEGDILAEIETDKATMEFESFNAGTLLFVGIQEGESAPVDSVLAIIGPEGTNIAGIAENYKKVGNVTPEASEPVAEKAVEVSNPTSNNQNSSSNPTDRIFASPLAKKIAQDKGINLSQVKGSGENGRIIKEDVARFAIESQKPKVESQPTTKTQGASPVTQFVPAGEKFSEEIKNSQMRKTIAKRLSESIFTAPHFYLTIEIAMDEAMKSRATINTIPDTKVSFNDMVVKACAMALKKHPQVNSQWREDAMIINHHVNIGVAVAVEDGLVVPVLNFTDQMSLTQIGSSVRDLAGKAKTKKLTPAEMDGSTFTVSNLGMFGITEFTSIINQPNSAILSVGAIVEKPVVRNGQIVVGNTMKVTLACDHRTVDGATGAQFLQTLKQFVENPVTMLA
ncbi:pyruvate dehydrogenase [Flavobacterium psychrophilum]|jgi:pyruvate dehydrogenase E2 component (dihydrolipoamide acetyltransferase)|uniref:Dihydrolipoamide acetyltransferase component of pyruvate dehydrogenase complex n=1 Tax=Flavobacterium psychrophilum (strain ATCC 49511 / DSM 21280 / CIP 103535 / JIP02/86) TaxID=402612 RepID=A6GZE4_FLAPJ|nr:pyruvate dehydrogenase complex dihydrolipoamide acetyltransferase [Flavobacterium psychrophilum]AIG30171.1 pyruvate dehydrogenase [Flavobacterium psychrophilum]AIG32446.1 pyruvate dehydrogenase [Flavobacterium psychrophilum]AIG34605.1 pyruvate dehydrogenase [Flavobacterium psychrophilum]AIG36965.1 pyruvate dehydrogenase [Flavobacterium psychrophilum]AIG39229.1 pyruvate dehydrogenase [Flavobacterium psychrophilum]